MIEIPKQKWRPKTPSDWNSEPIDNEEGYEMVESCFGKGITLRKKITEFEYPTPNPSFHYVYNETVDAKEFNKHLILEPDLEPDIVNRVKDFVKKYWDTFREEGVKIPIQGYKMVIDTGDTKPIAVPLPRYGMYEAPVMQKTIDRLLDFGHIRLDNKSPWGFRITLAPKPHQEDVKDIEEYIWRFCINYIQLNRVTRPSEYPIPRCDDAVMYGFGTATCFILLDAFSGYHQIRLSAASIDKTAFYAPFGRKYVWLVMPFGLRNAPAIFISMMHDFKALWTMLCEKHKINPSENEGSTIIMDDCFMFSYCIENVFIITECVCIIARKYHLTWKLKKCRWLPKEVEFVGVDISKKGNSPARSKFERLEQWKTPTCPRDIMSFIGFAIFYLRWISHFELRVKPLRALIKEFPIDHQFTAEQFTQEHKTIFETMKDFILSKPILQRANISKRFYLKTDFSKVGLGWALCQPDDSEAAREAMKIEDEGGECVFDCTLSSLRLLPIAFGGRKTIGNEEHFHSHPGEALSASFGIKKNRHFLWGRTFTLMSDCRALLWLFSYEGNNHAVRRLQLEMLGYWFTIINRPGYMMADANFFSRLAENLHIDPLLKNYIEIARQMRSQYTPEEGNITSDNLPGRRKRKSETNDSAPPSTLFAQLEFKDINTIEYNENTFSPLQNIPVSFCTITNDIKHTQSYSSHIVATAARLTSYQWCLYNPKVGQFLQTCQQCHLPFEAPLVIETNQSCRNFLQENFNITNIKSTTDQAIRFLQSDKATEMQGYYATLSTDNATTAQQQSQLLTKQIQLIEELHKRAKIYIFVLEFKGTFPESSIKKMHEHLLRQRWRISTQTITHETFSDKLQGSFRLNIGYHHHYFHEDIPFKILQPPIQPIDINEHIDTTLNQERFSIPYLEDLFEIKQGTPCEAREPEILLTITPKNSSLISNNGYEVYSTDHPVPLPTTETGNLFGQLFGILFHDPITRLKHLRSISHYEYASIFLYERHFCWKICTIKDILSILRQITPYRTLYSILYKIFECLDKKRSQEIQHNNSVSNVNYNPTAFLNGITPHQLPSDFDWTTAYEEDNDCRNIKNMLDNPRLITEQNLRDIHFIYRAPMRNRQIIFENNRLFYLESIEASHKFAKLIIVPSKLRKHIFTAFHSNPVGGHFGVYQTLHRIRLRYYWPNMYNYIRQLIKQCAGCLMKNTSTRSGTELLYSFPLDAPFITITGDIWSPGKTEGYSGATALMIILCHMTGFAAIEPISSELNSTSFAKSAYRIMLRYGLPHLFISDPDSKFHGEFKEMCTILKIKHHTTAKGNHNAVIVERFNRFLNSSLRIFNNDRGTNMVFLEGAELSTYAWNSAPVSGTDLSRSLVALGREFHFPIDFESRRHRTINIDESTVKSFAHDMLSLLEKSQEVYKLLIHEHRALHREYRNSQLNQPRKFKVGDFVFTNVQVQSNKRKGVVGKLSYVKRGPYKIIECHKSGSYTLKSTHSSTTIKKHGSDLILSPKVISPVQAIDTSDQIYSEFNKKVVQNPFEVIRIKGYNEAQPWAAPAASAQLHQVEMIPFPTVEELDNEYDSWPDSYNPFSPSVHHIMDKDTTDDTLVHPDQVNKTDMTMQAFPTLDPSNDLSSFIASIIQSSDKLLFISYKQNNETRREWKLVQIDFDTSISNRPTCLQDGIFFVIFYIEHPHDSSLHNADKRYWIEYHRQINHKSISENYNLIQPSETSVHTAKDKNLIPYSEWIDLRDKNTYIHGPFNFDKRNGRKTRDKISIQDWDLLTRQSSKYQNDQPNTKSQRSVQVHWNYPISLTSINNSVKHRVASFISMLDLEEKTIEQYKRKP